jgi:hypothetical protein
VRRSTAVSAATFGQRGLAPTGLHILRHTAAKLRRDAGASIEAVSSFLDHSSLAVTSIYLRRLEGEADRTWPDVAVAIWVCPGELRDLRRRRVGHGHRMSDPTALPPPTLVSTGSRVEEGSTAAADDGALLRLATWLAEVSAEAAQRRPAGDAEPPVVEPAS